MAWRGECLGENEEDRKRMGLARESSKMAGRMRMEKTSWCYIVRKKRYGDSSC